MIKSKIGIEEKHEITFAWDIGSIEKGIGEKW